MLLAKVALGFCGTLALACAYTFHEGVMRVDEVHDDGRHVHVWVPAALVPMALHVIPNRHFDHAVAQAGPWLPTLHALAKELRRYPEAQLVEVEDGRQHVRVRTQKGKLLIDVTQPGEDVHVVCPLAMIEDVANQLEARVPAA